MIPIKKRLIPLYETIATNFMGKTFNRPSDKIAFIFLAADQNNLGDLAIRQAQEWFIQKLLPKHTVISITQADTYLYLKSIREQLNSDDVIFLQGGGSFGDLYPKADYGRLFICRFFHDTHICSLPQTIFFSNTSYGNWRKKINMRKINRRNNITIFAREKKSYTIARDLFKNVDIQLCPDIVLSLLPLIRKKYKKDKRSGIIITFRTDAEKQLSEQNEQRILKYIKGTSKNIEYVDTDQGGERVASTDSGFKKVDKLLNQYTSSELVITDRLHGMIFAAITGTPCIVLSNSNHKIEETYNSWLHDCNYIKFIKQFNIEDFKSHITTLTSESFKSNYSLIKFSFDNLESYIRQVVKK